MINIVHVDIHCNDEREITAVEIKLKSFSKDDEAPLSKNLLAATVSAAFFKTTLLADVGKSLKTVLDPKRDNVIDLFVSLEENNKLTYRDIANFTNALQKAIDNTSLF